MVWTVIFGALAAFGALCLLWILFGLLFGTGAGGEILLPEGAGEQGELLVRLLVLRDLGILSVRILVADTGLAPTERTALEKLGVGIYNPAGQPAGEKDGVEEIDGTGDSAGYHRSGGISEL